MISNSGVLVLDPVTVTLPVGTSVAVKEPEVDQLPVRVTVGVTESDNVMEGVGSLLDVTETVLVWVPDAVLDRVTDRDAGIDGVIVLLTDAASKPTVISIPQAWGSVSVAE